MLNLRRWTSSGVMLAVLCGTLLFTGCDALVDSKVCPASVEPAVVVEVRNAVTGVPEAKNADGRLIDGSYNDSMRVPSGNSEGVPTALAGADERAGTYTVLVEKQNFESWSQSGIEVSEGECGVKTERVTAELRPIQEE